MPQGKLPSTEILDAESASRTSSQVTTSPSETDVTRLAADFSDRTGGQLPAKVSAELALEIVLNEVVEQACLATNATGAAVALQCGDEMVCLATNGSTAPPLGAQLDATSGLSGECIKTRRAQRCDDAEFAPSADVEAMRLLGVRSVLLVPILHGDDLLGVLELSSPRVSAFGERDERTLEALAHRIIKNFSQVAQVLPASAKAVAAEPVLEPVVPAAAAVPDRIGPESVPAEPSSLRPPASEVAMDAPPPPPPVVVPSMAPVETWDAYSEPAEGEDPADRGLDLVTWALAAAVLVCAILLGGLVGRHFGWQQATVHAGRAGQTPARGQSGIAPAAVAGTGMSSTGKKQSNSPGLNSTSNPAQPAPPAGGLLVYENGREVFRMDPTSGEVRPSTSKPKTGIEPASLSEPESDGIPAPAKATVSLLRRVEPDYPEEARQQNIQGPVVLDVRIAQDGAVEDLKLVSGPPLLAQAATDAVKQWKFKPKALNGRPVEMQTRVTLNFRLPRG